MKNAFYFGDNLHILREYIPDESVDLIYLDPPFNSNANYNLLFKSPDKSRWSDAQIATFEDTWSWGEAAEETFEFLENSSGRAGPVIGSLRRVLGENDMLAYLTMMAARLVEMERVLKKNGSLYLHCDPTASHYLKVVLDGLFGPTCFRQEISWKRTYAHGNASKNYGSVLDKILYYSKGSPPTWNAPFRPLSHEKIAERYRQVDEHGRFWQSVTLRNPSDRPNLKYDYTASNGVTYKPHRNGWSCGIERMTQYDKDGRLHFPSNPDGALRLKMYADESQGERVPNLWDDIGPLGAQARERLGYPTQKPLLLLERIIETSSNPGDTVLDPFCGCGTTLHAAHQLGRQWLGIDVAVQAMRVVQDRLVNEFPAIDFGVFGIPQSADAARYLALKHPFKFEEWAVAAIGGMHSGKYTGDTGIDGTFFWQAQTDEKSRGLISVKGGRSLNPGMIRDLVGTLERERKDTDDPNAIAVFVCAHTPTRGMREEARKAGYVETSTRRVPAVQILSVTDIFNGQTIDVPALFDTVSAAAAGRTRGAAHQFRDPREIQRQRAMFFSFKGGKNEPVEHVMTEKVIKAA